MTFKPKANMAAFFQQLLQCRGDVWFITTEGDQLNLKSTLSQFIFVAAHVGQMQPPVGVVHLDDPNDLPLLQNYLQP